MAEDGSSTPDSVHTNLTRPDGPQGPPSDSRSLVSSSNQDKHPVANSEPEHDPPGPCPNGNTTVLPLVPKQPVKSAQIFLQSLRDAFEDMQVFVSTTEPDNITLNPPLRHIDVRVATIVALEGVHKDDKISKTAPLLRGLSRRSLALEYESWEIRRTGTSQIKTRVETQRSVGRSGSMTDFLRENQSRFGTEYERTVRHAITDGNKIVVFERLLKEIGYLAILIILLNDYRKVKYADLEELICALRGQAFIKAFAEQSSSWMRRWITKYNAWCAAINGKLDSHANMDDQPNMNPAPDSNTKRPLDSNPSSRSKRHCRPLVPRQSNAEQSATHDQGQHMHGGCNTTPERTSTRQPVTGDSSVPLNGDTGPQSATDTASGFDGLSSERLTVRPDIGPCGN
ncbi:MAG: hypothetical protein L6R39_000023 [Caloplaca ligustica]|nr:MAG: hypothetical protein L6R39_000023 [Caloplaca ligustica]